AEAQGVKKTALVKGRLLNSTTKAPFNDLKVAIPDIDVFATSDGEGKFEISEVPYGDHKLVINGIGSKRDTINISVNSDIVDLKEISIIPNKRDVSIDNEDIPT